MYTKHTCTSACTASDCLATARARAARLPKHDTGPCVEYGDHRPSRRHARHVCPAFLAEQEEEDKA